MLLNGADARDGDDRAPPFQTLRLAVSTVL